MTEVKRISLEAAQAALQKRYGKTSVFKGKDYLKEDVEAIPSGCLMLDLALDVGGWPKGRIVEVSGPEASGKSLLTVLSIAKAQKEGKKCLFVDAEHTADEKWFRTLGVDWDTLLIAKPEYFEEALDVIDTFADTGAVELIVWDSVPALLTLSEYGDEGKNVEAKKAAKKFQSNVGGFAKPLTSALRRWTPKFSRMGITGLFINQLRDKIGSIYGDPTITPGGRAFKHHASVRVAVGRIGGSFIKTGSGDNEETIGHKIKIRVIKNKVSSRQGVSAEFTIYYTRGIDEIAQITDAAIKLGVIERPNNRTYVYPKLFKSSKEKEGKWNSRDNYELGIREDEELIKEITEEIYRRLHDASFNPVDVEGEEFEALEEECEEIDESFEE